jgi:hypothetical protein
MSVAFTKIKIFKKKLSPETVERTLKMKIFKKEFLPNFSPKQFHLKLLKEL